MRWSITITNYVAMNKSANVLQPLGAKRDVNKPEETADFARIACR